MQNIQDTNEQEPQYITTTENGAGTTQWGGFKQHVGRVGNREVQYMERGIHHQKAMTSCSWLVLSSKADRNHFFVQEYR